MVSHFFIILRTVRYLKFTQAYFQIYYRLKNIFFKHKNLDSSPNSTLLIFSNHIQASASYHHQFHFNFLNLAVEFQNIDWNFPDNGKLWTYNLNYFEFLLQSDLSKDEGLFLMKDFCEKQEALKDGNEPYPISLRCINWIKFISQNSIQEKCIDLKLYNDFIRLSKNIEYHILANHYLENGFGLLFGSYYFQDETLYNKARKIIESQLEEQILQDGAHYELSPMYHQIILHRILDAYQLITLNHWKEDDLSKELRSKASLMLGWLKNLTFSNGDLPMVNDSTYNIAPRSQELFDYAKRLGIKENRVPLNQSGYRMMRSQNLELFFDVGQIAPSYQPGHSHADNLQIIIYKNGQPVVVDTGISTYEKNERRQWERSTVAHNTFTIDNENSSEVWSGFRIGRRARTSLLVDQSEVIMAEHDGYRNKKIKCQRQIQKVQNGFLITDKIIGKDSNAHAYLHFHPSNHVTIKDSMIRINNNNFIQFNSPSKIEISEYGFCTGFNKTIKAQKICYSFHQQNSFTLLR